MGKRRSWTDEAVVLRVFDVGDADRFCILFTETGGRIPIRARGARKTGSSLGPSFLPLSHVRAELESHSAGVTVRSATILSSPRPDALALSVLQEAAELMLRFTEDGQESRDLFHLCREFFGRDGEQEDILPFSLRMLWMLGLLPLSDDDRRYAALSASSKIALHRCLEATAVRFLETERKQLESFVDAVLPDHLQSPRSVPAIRAALAGLR